MSSPAIPIFDDKNDSTVPLIAATAVPVESVQIVEVIAPATLEAGEYRTYLATFIIT
jgi:hypothetical protein